MALEAKDVFLNHRDTYSPHPDSFGIICTQCIHYPYSPHPDSFGIMCTQCIHHPYSHHLDSFGMICTKCIHHPYSHHPESFGIICTQCIHISSLYCRHPGSFGIICTQCIHHPYTVVIQIALESFAHSATSYIIPILSSSRQLWNHLHIVHTSYIIPILSSSGQLEYNLMMKYQYVQDGKSNFIIVVIK